MWQRGLTDEARSGTTRGRGGQPQEAEAEATTRGQPQEAEPDNHKRSLTAGGDSISSDYHGHLTNNASCLFVLCTRKTYLVSRRITFFSKSVGLAKNEHTNLEKDFML